VGLCGLLTLAVYASSLSGWYVYEDVPQGDFSAWPGLWASLLGLFSTPVGFVQIQSVQLTGVLSGFDPWWARVVSLGWHLGNGLLLWRVARRVLAPWGAVLAAAVFWLHPLQT
jgi:hypothetical protein